MCIHMWRSCSSVWVCDAWGWVSWARWRQHNRLWWRQRRNRRIGVWWRLTTTMYQSLLLLELAAFLAEMCIYLLIIYFRGCWLLVMHISIQWCIVRHSVLASAVIQRNCIWPHVNNFLFTESLLNNLLLSVVTKQRRMLKLLPWHNRC